MMYWGNFDVATAYKLPTAVVRDVTSVNTDAEYRLMTDVRPMDVPDKNQTVPFLYTSVSAAILLSVNVVVPPVVTMPSRTIPSTRATSSVTSANVVTCYPVMWTGGELPPPVIVG